MEWGVETPGRGWQGGPTAVAPLHLYLQAFGCNTLDVNMYSSDALVPKSSHFCGVASESLSTAILLLSPWGILFSLCCFRFFAFSKFLQRSNYFFIVVFACASILSRVCFLLPCLILQDPGWVTPIHPSRVKYLFLRSPWFSEHCFLGVPVTTSGTTSLLTPKSPPVEFTLNYPSSSVVGAMSKVPLQPRCLTQSLVHGTNSIAMISRREWLHR